MLRHSHRGLRPVRPRVAFGGFPKPWACRFTRPNSVEPDRPTLGQALSLPGEAVRAEAALSMDIGPPVRCGPATSVPFPAVLSHWQSLSSTHQKDGGTPVGTTLPNARRNSAAPDALARRLWALLQLPLASLFAPHGSLDWPGALLPFQIDGVRALLERRELLLADEMGLGKTIQAIAALRILYFRGDIHSCLIVCPASLLTQWARELHRWAPELIVAIVRGNPQNRALLWQTPAHVRLISYDTLRCDVMEIRDSPALRKSWGVVLLDEASRIKNREAGVAVACKLLPRERRWALTGTPLENQMDDLRSILDFILGDPHRAAGIPAAPVGLRELLQRVQVRRRKADVLPELPLKQINEVYLELLPRQRLAYENAEREGIIGLNKAGDSVTVTHVLELISRLKQLCNRDAVSRQSTKLCHMTDRLGAIVEEGGRALVFSQYTDHRFGTAWLMGELAAYRPVELTGAMSTGQRQDAVDRFMDNPANKAMVLSLRAGGVGLNLQNASYVFHLDRWWNPAIEDQAESRSHRMGQLYPVTIYKYICVGTIEEKIDAKLREKRALFSELVDDVSLDLQTVLDEGDLFGLFGLTPPRSKTVHPVAG